MEKALDNVPKINYARMGLDYSGKDINKIAEERSNFVQGVKEMVHGIQNSAYFNSRPVSQPVVISTDANSKTLSNIQYE